MAAASSSGQGRLTGFALAEAWRNAAYRFLAGPLYRLRYPARVPERLLIAPTDLRTADPMAAVEIYSGRFTFAADHAEAGGGSIFTAQAPTEEWTRHLHGFSWLRHLRASDMALSRSNARALVADWIRLQGKHGPIANEPEVTARRVISWLAQTPLVLEGADEAFYWKFMRSLAKQVRLLRRVAGQAPAGLPRLRVLIALADAALAMGERERTLTKAMSRLDRELTLQVLPDGGHISRNPRATLDILVDLLPLRQAFTARGVTASPVLIGAVDRMMPMLRFFRHGDGSFARFNGTGDTPADLVATVLAYDDARGKPVQSAPHSGFHRLQAGTTVLIADMGPPPPIAVSATGHAGCLSFELSVGRQLLVVNCGTPHPGNDRLRRLARTTAAHSTATLNDASSCRFLTRPGLSGRLGEVITGGPDTVAVERHQVEHGIVLIGRHNGYSERFGVLHQRRLALTAAGDELIGEDSFSGRSGGAVNRSGKDSYAIRFHLHPSVSVRPTASLGPIELVLSDGEMWEFTSDADDQVIEDSILFSDVRGSRATRQIVIYGRIQHRPTITWQLSRIHLGNGQSLSRERTSST